MRFAPYGLALVGASLLAGSGYFVPEHRVPGIGVDRGEMTPEVLQARTDRMIESQTFVIMREPEATAGAERITGEKLAPLFRRAAADIGWPASLLSAVAYLESWGNAEAVSPAGPRGIMQFSEATARIAGLHIVRERRYQITTERRQVRKKSGKMVYRTVRHRTPYFVTVRDDRLDPKRAIPAAAKYLERLESRLGARDWAIFAYHCGEGCASGLLPLAQSAVHHKPTVAEMFFAATPARHRELYEALREQMQRDYSPTYWFRIQRADQLLNLYETDPEAFRELAEDYRNPDHPQRRVGDRLSVWLKSQDIAYRSADDAPEAVLDDPAFFGFSLAERRGTASPAAYGALLYVAFETRRLFEEMKPKGERFVALRATPDSGGEVVGIDRSNLPRGERECLRFALDDLGWAGYLGWVPASGDAVHIGSSPSSRDFFATVFREASEAK